MAPIKLVGYHRREGIEDGATRRSRPQSTADSLPPILASAWHRYGPATASTAWGAQGPHGEGVKRPGTERDQRTIGLERPGLAGCAFLVVRGREEFDFRTSTAGLE